MTLTFELINKKFEDTLSVSIGNETKLLSSENNRISFEIDETDTANIQVKHLLKVNSKQIKNPILRRILTILIFPLLVMVLTINFLADNDNGISIHKFFYGETPFTTTKSFKIAPINNKPIMLEFVNSQYKRLSKSFSKPNILIHNADVRSETQEINYDSKAMRHDFYIYHCPAYAVLFSIIIALNILMIICLRDQFIAVPISYFGVIGIGFCCVIMLTLLIVFICMFVFTYRLYRQVDANMTQNKDFET